MVTSYARRPLKAQVCEMDPTPELFDMPTHVFVAGCIVSAVRGEIRAETLRAGDRLRTRDGRHILVEKVCALSKVGGSSPIQEALRPLTVRRGTLASGTPKRDLPVTRNQPIIGGAHGATAERAAKDLGGRVTTATLSEHAPKLILVTCEDAVAINAGGIWLGPNPGARYLDTPRPEVVA